MKHHLLVVTVVCIAAAILCADARAEVRVITDRYGEYKMTRVMTAGRGGLIWTPFHRGSRRTALNVRGDRNGDLWPTVGESNLAPHHPWAVWSRLDSTHYKLAWSRWTRSGWDPIRWLQPPGDAVGDSLDADIAFGEAGRPFVVWWREEDGVGKIYVSLFLQTVWMQAFQVSETHVDSRYPSIVMDDDQILRVRYDTPEGTMEQSLALIDPGTITDDINPLDRMLLLEGMIVVDDED